jgi:glycine dehydrogenase
MYGVYHGPQGLRAIATTIHRKAVALNEALAQLGYVQSNAQFFDTLHLPADEALQARIRTATEARGINVGYYHGAVLVSAHEVANVQDLQDLVDAFAEAAGKATVAVNPQAAPALATNQLRTSEYLTHPAFNSYHSESEMMRYIKKLERKDLSLNHSMISLGSCTMKLNAASEMLPLSWPAWGQMHPFVPAKQAAGYMEVIAELERDLAIVTGFDATSLQPNSGAQGEYAGLMVIRAYHLSRGDAHRNVALIPSSAHGTNPASAVMAGLQVVVVKCDDNGNVDVEDLRAKAIQHKDNLAALMVTYPSTHGVFEEASLNVSLGAVHQWLTSSG